ncbi:probable PRS1 - ribose-phosphate pyrophosphokinase [Cephalotrichum gorgonifer]|uniref:ribose-phosphate diphosphokinase n=1 Tax=Cephalotrichum gorgonifer TaxID=2041049 RepID=A0AAE8MYR5_9PEZI|nr:probable PRS1 - ribose-phosphate pyrophosphokinase [Cephalotrichum gorgonifer]
MTSVREKDVFVIQSGSPRINDTIMELLIMISACKGGSATKITAVVPYFPYNRQSKKKSHRGTITARLLANLMGVAGVKHVITVDLHASQMQGFFKCPVDNLHAEPLIARWIRHNVPNWKDGVVVSKNAGGTKRVTSLADALKLNFGIITTDKKRVPNMTTSMIMNHLDGIEPLSTLGSSIPYGEAQPQDSTQVPASERVPARQSQAVADSRGSPVNTERLSLHTSDPESSSSPHSPAGQHVMASPVHRPSVDGCDDRRAGEVTQGRLVHGHIVDDDFPSSAVSTVDNSQPDIDPMTQSHASSFFAPEANPFGPPGGEDPPSSDEEEATLTDPKIEHMITLVGNVRNRPVFIVDDMIDKPGSWIAAAETVVKRGGALKVYCMATHGVFGGDSLAQLQACECIDAIVVTNSFPINEEQAKNSSKLVILDLSPLLAEAIRRNHYGESISPLFQHYTD